MLQHRPLPEVPPSSQDDLSTLASLGFLHSLAGSGGRWASRENLLMAVEDEDGDPQLFVALYDFQAGGENQLSLKKGEQVSNVVLSFPFICIETPFMKCYVIFHYRSAYYLTTNLASGVKPTQCWEMWVGCLPTMSPPSILSRSTRGITDPSLGTRPSIYYPVESMEVFLCENPSLPRARGQSRSDTRAEFITIEYNWVLRIIL